MALFKDIIDEFKTVADAFASVSYFVYDRVSRVNGTLQNKAYPMILINSTPNFERGANNNTFYQEINSLRLTSFVMGIITQQKERLKAYSKSKAR